MSSAFTATTDRIGLPRIGVHGLRHSYATAALRAGVSPEVVSKRLDHVATTANTQIAGRIHPRLIDLVAALATGTVGAFALARSNVSDALPPPRMLAVMREV